MKKTARVLITVVALLGLTALTVGANGGHKPDESARKDLDRSGTAAGDGAGTASGSGCCKG